MGDYLIKAIEDGGWTLLPIYLSCVLGWFGVFRVLGKLFKPGTTIDRLQKQTDSGERLSKAIRYVAKKQKQMEYSELKSRFLEKLILMSFRKMI